MIRRLLCLALALATAAPLAAAETPELKSATVTIPYSELRTLWEAARAKPPLPPPEPPVPYVIAAARFTVDLGADPALAEGTAKFEINVLREGPTLVPLLGSDVALVEIAAEGGTIVPSDGRHCFYSTAPGRKNVTLRFAARARGAGGFGVRMVPASTGEITFNGVPAGQQVEMPLAVRIAGSGAPRFRFGAADALEFQLVPLQANRPKPAPATWQIQTRAAVRLEDGRLDATALILATQSGGGAPVLVLTLPGEAGVRNVESANLERWENVRSDDGRERRLTLVFKRPEEARRVVALSYDLPAPPAEGEWAVAVPIARGAEQERRTAFLVEPAATELTSDRAATGTTLPTGLAEFVGTARYLAVECEAGDALARATAKRRAIVATASATVEAAHYQTSVVHDGAGLTSAKLIIRHERAQALRIELPAGAELQTCLVEGAAVSPLQAGSGAFEIPLAPRAGRVSAVEFSYSLRHVKFAAVSGELTLSLPKVDLFANLVTWDVTLPPKYELTAAEGNVQLAPALVSAAAVKGAEPAAAVVRLRKEFTRGEAPTVALYYQKGSLDL